MDEVQMKLTTSGFLCKIIAKMITHALKTKLGCKIDLTINDIDIQSTWGNTQIHLDLNAGLSKDEFIKLLKNAKISDAFMDEQ